METTYYTLPAHKMTVSSAAPAYEEPVVRKLVCLHRETPVSAGVQGRVIDFTAWKQEHDQLVPQAPTPVQIPSTPDHSSRFARMLGYGEWAATLAVVGTMLLLMWRILVA